MGSIWNNIFKKSKKDLPEKNSDTKSLALTNGTAVSVITQNVECKSYSKSLSSKSEITIKTNGKETMFQHKSLTSREQFAQSKSSITSKSNTKEIKRFDFGKKNTEADAIPFNIANEIPYKNTNIQKYTTSVVLPSGHTPSKVPYQSPYRNSSGISSFGDKNYSFVTASRTPTSTNKTLHTKEEPKTSVPSSKTLTYSWNNSPKLSCSVLHQQPPAPLGVKPIRKQSPGLVFIFHNDKFDSPNEFRYGSAADVRLLTRTFQNFKTPITTYENLTVKEVTRAVEKIEKKDFGNCSCVVIIILTHGTRHGSVYAKDGSYSINDDVLFPILRNKSLISKPKLFFIQACKGHMEPEHLHKDAVAASGSPQEILKCYSTFEGYVAYRTEKGTFFIQALCELLQELGKTTNIKDIMDKVIKRVQEMTRNKQIPSYETTLTKPYIFGDYI